MTPDRTIRQAALCSGVLPSIEALTDPVSPVINPRVRADGTYRVTVAYNHRDEDSDERSNGD
jgi:hypothetical protein